MMTNRSAHIPARMSTEAANSTGGLARSRRHQNSWGTRQLAVSMAQKIQA